MSTSDEWSPDQALDETETYESWDEALDDEDSVTPGSLDDPEGERSLDTQLYVDAAENEGAGVNLDDPEGMAVLDGDIDDPDGLELTDDTQRRPDADEGWDLDAEERQTERSLDGDPTDSTQ